MKTVYKIALAAFAFVAAASCSNVVTPSEPQESVPAGFVQKTFTASLADTKTSLTDAGAVLWEVGDEVAVYDGIAAEPNKFTVTAADAGSATLTGNVSEGATSFAAVYPFTSAQGYAEGSFTVNVPNPQVIPAGKNISSSALVAVAVAADGEVLPFKNVASVMKFTVGEGVESILFTGNSSEKFLGIATATADGVSTGSTLGRLKVSSESGSFAPGTYYAVVLPTTFEAGFTTAVSKADGKYVKVGASKAECKRSCGLSLGDPTASATFLPFIINTKADWQNFAANAGMFVTSDVIKLGADINLEGAACDPISGFTGSLDGQNHSIYNFTLNCAGLENVGLFDKLANGNTIKDLKLGCDPSTSAYDGTSAILSNDNTNRFVGPLAGMYKSVAGVGAAQIVNVTNYIPVTNKAVPSDVLRMSGIIGGVGENSQIVFQSCVNYGNIDDAHTAKPAKNIYLGGMVGLSTSPIKIYDCENHGQIRLGVSFENASASFAAGILGRVGSGTSGHEIARCLNTGAITVSKNVKQASYISGILAADNNTAGLDVFDIVISDCVNKGDIGSNSQSAVCVFGGIIGLCRCKIKISGCQNEGRIWKGANHNKTKSSYGGIVALAEGCDGALVENCINKGNLEEASHTNTSESIHSFGGIVGMGDIDVVGCSNSGNITMACSVTNPLQYAGGIVGYHINKSDAGGATKIESCTNTGNISNGAPGASCCAGGIIGCQCDCAATLCQDCVTSGTITGVNAGAVVGGFTASASATVFGTADKPVKVSGTVGETALTSANYADFLSGALNKGTRTFNAQFAL